MDIHLTKIRMLLILSAIAILGAACAAPTPTPAPTLPPQPTAVPQPTLAPTNVPPTVVVTTAPVAGITLTDGAGRTVTLPGEPARLVSLAPSNTEIVCALGACDKLVGIDQFSDFPAEVKAVPIVSDGFNVNYEAVVAAKPDLVLVAAITSSDVIAKLDELKLPMLVVGSVDSSFEAVKNDIQLLGRALGESRRAGEVNAGIDARLAELDAKLAQAKTKPRVFWELDATDPAKPFTPGPGTFINEIIGLAGGENIAGKAPSPYVQLNAEEIIQSNPEIIILSDAAYGVAPESVGQRPGWAVIDAVRNNKVFPIDDNLVSRPGPRVIDGLEAAAKLIHPEVFESTSAEPTFDDPFAYCSAVGNADKPAPPYNGSQIPASVALPLREAMGATTPDDVWFAGTFWRCMGGKVYACNVGANIPCEAKADTNRTPTSGEVAYCQQNPTADIIPAFVTGHETIFEWACRSGAPEIVRQVQQVDARGYQVAFWHLITGP